MESFRIHHDIRVEKANVISRYRRIQRITALFRFAELFVFLIILSSQFAFSFNLLVEYIRQISITLVSPRPVFLLGNAIVIALFFISGGFSQKDGARSPDFYEEYMAKCRKNHPSIGNEEKAKAIEAYRCIHKRDQRKMQSCQSQNPERIACKQQLRRSMTEKPNRKGADSGRRSAAAGVARDDGGRTYAEDEMSNEEFRRTVEAFIARQQRFLREEEDFPARVSG